VTAPSPLDEQPLHQAPLSLRYMDTSDRNAYDRCYLNAHDRTGDIFLITGLGVYPNLGVIDAFASVGRGDRIVTVRACDALPDDRRQAVGPFRVEVIEPLRKLRIVCDGADHGVGYDLTWEGSFPAVEEPRHVIRRDGRIIVDACRFAQVGTWQGTLHVENEDVAVDQDRWVGTRDRSWGIRPVGEAEPVGRPPVTPPGLWWLYTPLRFDDYALVVIVQEEQDGTRTLNEAVRVWPDGTVEQLGWPHIEIGYRSGTRLPQRAVMHLGRPSGTSVDVEIESLGFVPLNCGPGYGNDPTWSHGQWRGEGWVEGTVVTYSDPDVATRVPFAVVDHVARATCDGSTGFGLFEHASIGRHDPSGFADLFSVAP
jgi:hypothetical protein